MAYRADGTWTPEDDDVSKAVAGVVDAGGPLMKQARGLGQMVANKRGLSNSSIAAGTAATAVLDKATAIGGQQSSQTHAKNLAAINAGENFKYGTTLQQMQDTAAKERLGMQIDADASLQSGQLASQKEIAGMQIASNEKLSAADIAARMSELNTKIAGDLKLAQQGDASAMERLQVQLSEQAKLQAAQITSTESIAAADRAASLDQLNARIAADIKLAHQGDQAAMERLTADLASREQLQSQQNAADLTRQREQIAGSADLQTAADKAAAERQAAQLASSERTSAADREATATNLATQIAGNKDLAAQNAASDLEKQRLANSGAMDLGRLDATTKLNLGELDAATSRANNALSAASNLNAAYLNSMAASLQNENIPAEARQAFQESAKAATEASLGLIEQITGQDLAWGNNTLRPQSVAPAPPQDYSWNDGQSTRLADGTQLYKQADGSTLRINPDGTQTILPAAAA